jgi:hypothetical protein
MCAQFDNREDHTRSTKSLGGVRISQEKPSQKLAPADLSADPCTNGVLPFRLIRR